MQSKFAAMEKRIDFHADGLCLNGTLHLPTAARPPVVIGVHGMLSTGQSPKQRALAERLNQRGIAYFRFDHRGCGQSEGRFAKETTFEGRCNDLVAAIETVTALPAVGTPLGLFGSSMGGAVCLSVAADFAVKTLVTLAAPVRFAAIEVPIHVAFDPAFAGMTPHQMEFDIAGRLHRIKNIFIVHGDADKIVPYENAEQILSKSRDPKELFRLKGADHPLSDPAHQEQFMSKTIAWFASRLH
ncbi:MAG: alpha/beta hydrolase [Thermodesulfobacteriota bacterium]